MAGIGNAIGKFAEGLVTGYDKGKKNIRENELHEAQMQKIRDEQQMNAEIKKLNESTVKPVESYVVQGEDGSKTVYTDPAMAADASVAVPGSQVLKKILVAGKQYDTPDEAQTAAEQANSPIAKMRMAGDIAIKYNRPDIASEYQKAYKVRVDQNRQDAQQTVMDAMNAGDTEGVLKAYNDRLPNGRKAELIPGENGGFAIQLMQGKTPVGAPREFKDPKTFFDTVLQQVGTTPDNAMEVWKHSQTMGMQQQGLNLQARGVAVQEATGQANVEQTKAQTAMLPQELAIKKQQVAASMMGAQASMVGAGASATNAQTSRMGLTMPKINSGVNDSDEVAFNTTQPVYDDKKKEWGLRVTPAIAVPGMNPTMTAKTFAPPKPDMFGLNTAPQKVPTAEDIAAALGALKPKKATTQ